MPEILPVPHALAGAPRLAEARQPKPGETGPCAHARGLDHAARRLGQAHGDFPVPSICATLRVSWVNLNGLLIICMPGSRKPPRTAACSA